MNFLTTVLLFLHLSKRVCSRPNLRVVGGQKAEQGEWAFMAAIWRSEEKDQFIPWHCGASIIAPQHAVTAAHCVQDETLKTSKLFLYLGHTNFDNPEGDYLYTVEKVFRHEQYNLGGFNHNDIAVLKLKEPIDFAKYKGRIAPLAFADESKINPKVCLTMGWGLTSFSGQDGSPDLLEIGLQLEESTVCETLLGASVPYFFCSKNIDYNGAWKGDSGGPMICAVGRDENQQIQYALVGINSYITNDTKGLLGTAYTNALYYKFWVETQLIY